MQDVHNYDKTCFDCKMRKKPVGKQTRQMKTIVVTELFEQIGLDVLGPFPRSESGNRYAVIAIDYLTIHVRVSLERSCMCEWA